MKKNIYKFALVLTLFLLFAEKSFAATSDVLPEMMVGQSTAVVNGQTTYGGMTGNYAVYNHESTSTYGFNSSLLGPGCTGEILQEISSGLCFILGTGPLGESSAGKNSRLMTSRTRIDIGDGNGLVAIQEIPALFLGANIIVGDTFGSIDYNKFSFWGNNMSTTKDATSTDALWNLKSYSLDSGSQSAWLKDDGAGVMTETDAYKQYYDKVAKLAANGTVLTTAEVNSIESGSDIFLQKNKITLAASVSEIGLYPEGKTWIVDGNLNITSGVTYHGKGTIIVKGNITLAEGVKIKTDPADLNAKLGIMSITK